MPTATEFNPPHSGMGLFRRLAGHYLRALDMALADCQSALDVGCGASSPLGMLERRVPYTLGVDAFQPSLDESRRKGLHSEYRTLTIGELGSAFPQKSFDAVLALDVIEHLSKEGGRRLMQDMEALARMRVVIFTPNGFLPQEPHSGNEYQRHVSGWTVDEFRELGFEVVGINGWRPLRGAFAQARFKPAVLWEALSLLTQPLVSSRPALAFQLLAVKKLG